jgi:hypothetical protein
MGTYTMATHVEVRYVPASVQNTYDIDWKLIFNIGLTEFLVGTPSAFTYAAWVAFAKGETSHLTFCQGFGFGAHRKGLRGFLTGTTEDTENTYSTTRVPSADVREPLLAALKAAMGAGCEFAEAQPAP